MYIKCNILFSYMYINNITIKGALRLPKYDITGLKELIVSRIRYLTSYSLYGIILIESLCNAWLIASFLNHEK